jgi:hypothetical protein
LQKPTVTSKDQKTLPKDESKVLDFSGILKRPGQKPVTLEEMDEAISKGATDQDVD